MLIVYLTMEKMARFNSRSFEASHLSELESLSVTLDD